MTALCDQCGTPVMEHPGNRCHEPYGDMPGVVRRPHDGDPDNEPNEHRYCFQGWGCGVTGSGDDCGEPDPDLDAIDRIPRPWRVCHEQGHRFRGSANTPCPACKGAQLLPCGGCGETTPFWWDGFDRCLRCENCDLAWGVDV